MTKLFKRHSRKGEISHTHHLTCYHVTVLKVHGMIQKIKKLNVSRIKKMTYTFRKIFKFCYFRSYNLVIIRFFVFYKSSK